MKKKDVGMFINKNLRNKVGLSKSSISVKETEIFYVTAIHT